MNTLAIIVSVLSAALAASTPANPNEHNIKDNRAFLLSIGKSHCDFKAEAKIKIVGDESSQQALPFLYPVVLNNTEITLTKADNNEDSTFIEDSNGAYPAFEGHFVMADRGIKEIVYTAVNQETEYQAYVIPPNVSSGSTNGKPHQRTFNVSVEFTCGGYTDQEMTKDFLINVTNNARSVSLVSATFALAISSFLLL